MVAVVASIVKGKYVVGDVYIMLRVTSLAGGGVGGGAAADVAGDADGEGVAGDALVDGVSCGGLIVRVLLVMVLGVGPRLGGHRQFWA